MQRWNLKNLKCWKILNIVLRLGLDLDGWFRCPSLSPGKTSFSSVMDCWKQWVVGKLYFKPFLWVRPRKSNLSQEHRISNCWVPLSFVLGNLIYFTGHRMAVVWWFVTSWWSEGCPRPYLWSDSNRKGIWPWFFLVPGGYLFHWYLLQNKEWESFLVVCL